MIPFNALLFIFISGVAAVSQKEKKLQNVIEGDIMLREDKDYWGRKSGPLVDMKKNRWTEGIVPYVLNETVYNAYDVYVINEALQEIEDFTCISFIRRTTEKDYIYITPDGGCWSYVGRQGGSQVVSLTVPDCINKGTVIHELMHVLGFWHEHNRSDRDDFIEIIWSNVIKDKEINFAKSFPEASNFLKFPYDYQSVMHYDAYAFSVSPRLPTMRPKQPRTRLRDLGRAKTIGTLTETDILEITELYEC
ncbi:zinc metalloproteinase nas-4 [Parasteatoda tepidariorum]|uniref:zinc metalloproteinase nas-4 n=1 Tax=Parasteatoda tepidariorum TaxID=114398 RepID=UPI001C71A87D|nr:zinc metalloproteinase nas-4 [Parasteatoda tepidariorum]